MTTPVTSAVISAVTSSVTESTDIIIPASAYLARWDISNIGSLWQDVAGTISVTADGQTVARIDDLFGSGLNLLKHASDATGIYRTSGGLHWIEMTNGAFEVGALSGDISDIDIAVAIEKTDTFGEMLCNFSGWGASGSEYFGNIVNGQALDIVASGFGDTGTRVDNVDVSPSNNGQMHTLLFNTGGHSVLFPNLDASFTANDFSFSGYATRRFTGKFFAMSITSALTEEQRAWQSTQMITKAGG